MNTLNLLTKEAMQLQEKNNKLNILFLSPRYHTNQISITRLLQNRGHNVYFHVKFFGQIENYENLTPILFEESLFTSYLKKIFFIKDKNLLYLPKLFKYYKYLKELEVNFVIIRIHGRVYSYLTAFLLKFLLKSNIIFYEQANSNLLHLKGVSPIKLLKKIEFYLRIKFFAAKWCTPLHNINTPLSKNCFYLPFAINEKKNIRKLSTKLRILIIGKFQNRKNQLLALKILKDLILEYKIKITFVGENTTKEHNNNFNKLKKYIFESKLDKYIKIHTNIDNSKINNFYLNNDVFFIPSYNEPASISILEAMSYGLPSICHTSCGTKTYIEDKYNGFILNSLNIESIKPIIEEISKDKKYLEKLTSNCTDYFKTNFSEEVYYNYFQQLIKFQK